MLSIGLLGIAALQMTSLRTNQGAHVRSQASVLAYDITDRMRANRDAAVANAYVIVLTGTPPAGMASTDLQNWKATLATRCRGVKVAIIRAATCPAHRLSGPTRSASQSSTHARGSEAHMKFSKQAA